MFEEALEPFVGRILVACSGGADSTALAHALMTRALRAGQAQPLLVYIDHGLRKEAEEEGLGVMALAATFGATATVMKVQVPQQASLEAAARDARYHALSTLADTHAMDWILLGHTASDQVETILMRILRGTGLVGLAGMPATRGRIARPFLLLRRQDTEKYCQDHGLAYIEDRMNRDEAFTRVRMRHRWLPALRKENPKVDEALLNLGAAARDHREVLDWAAQQFLRSQTEAKGSLLVNDEFRQLPASLATRVLVLHAAKSGITGLERRHLLALLAFARSQEAGTRSLSLPGARVRKSYASLEWNPDPDVGSSAEPDPVPGHISRRWRAGDRMRPERLKGRSRKLSALYSDGKVPKELRSQAWVLERAADGEIVWAEHIGNSFECQLLVTLR